MITSHIQRFARALSGSGTRDAGTIVHANAHHMATVIEDTAQTIARIRNAGSEVTVISRVPGGPMVVARDDLRVALGTGMAHRVMVARLDAGVVGPERSR